MNFKHLFRGLFGKKKLTREALLAKSLPRMRDNKQHAWIFRTKLFGLRVLRQICKKNGGKVLPYKVISKSEQFLIHDFEKPLDGRLIARVDLKTRRYTQSIHFFNYVPRLNMDLKSKSPTEAEQEIRSFMKNTQEYAQKALDAEVIFIVHHVPPLREYDKAVIVNVEVGKENSIKIQVANRAGYSFRDDAILNEYKLKISESGELLQIPGQKPKLDQETEKNVLTIINPMIRFAKATKHKRFETSFVTYKSSPTNPEFYDFLLGKHERIPFIV